MHFVYVSKIYKSKVDNLLPKNKKVEGENKEWKRGITEGVNGEHYPKNVGKEMVLPKELLEQIKEQNPSVVNPENYNSFPEFLNAVLEFAGNDLDRSYEVLQHIRRYAYMMADKKKNVYPIDFLEMNYTQYKLHMDYYKKTKFNKETGENYYGLKHRKDTMDTVIQAKGYPKEIFPYRLPHQPRGSKKFYPSPFKVHDMIHFDGYHKDKDVNKWYQYVYYYGFFIGPRAPKEICIQELENIHIDDGYMDILETKVYGRIRRVYPEQVILNGKTRKSIKNFVDKIRPRFVSQHSGDYLWISPYDGRPFNTDKRYRTFGADINKKGKLIDKRFHCYCMRDWCAVSRMIHAWYIKDPDPLEYVENYLGHEEQSTTEGYSRPARDLHRIYNFDWFPSVLKFSKKTKEENTRKSKHDKITFVSNGTTGERIHGPAEI